jgi:hypothetical protein
MWRGIFGDSYMGQWNMSKLMVMESINGKMETGMKDPGIIVSNTEKVLIYLPMETCILDHMFKVNLKEKESTNGKMEVYILVSLKTE